MKIAILSASVRKDRKSHRVSLFFKQFLESHHQAEIKMIDLCDYNFPIFEERLSLLQDPPAKLVDFAAEIKSADSIIIVTPEYNGGYPASLKNVIDVLYAEWKRKPIAISTVSAGAFGGSQVITSLQFTLWKIGALVIPAQFPVPTIDKSFDENGIPNDLEAMNKKATGFVNELIWWTSAKQKQEA